MPFRTFAVPILLLLGIAGNCQPDPSQPKPPAPHEVCMSACERLGELGCPEAEPTKKGATCVQVCVETESTGWTTMHPSCIAAAKTCEDASKVSAKGCD